MGKGYFFLLTTLPGRGWNMVGTKKWLFFFGPKNPDFGPKSIFFVWDAVFFQRGARNPRRWFRFGTFGSIVRLFVSELRPFLWGDPPDTPKSPPPWLGFRRTISSSCLPMFAALKLHEKCSLNELDFFKTLSETMSDTGVEGVFLGSAQNCFSSPKMQVKEGLYFVWKYDILISGYSSGGTNSIAHDYDMWGDLLRFVPCVIVWHRKKIFFPLQL